MWILTEATHRSVSMRQNNSTAEALLQVKQRIGQTQFSNAGKANYPWNGCFPDCKISDPKFLVESHIARWVNNPDKRGDTSNDLCFCPIHNKAFENGYFSFDHEFRTILKL